MTRRILVVDDEQAIRSTMERLLRAIGYEVVTVAEPMDAYELLDAGGFDLVLLDINMPGMSGDALFVALIRRSPQLASRVLLMSGDPGAVKGEWPEELRACPFLSKPFELNLLARLVAGAIAAADEAGPSRKRNGG
ncbi:MAG TPA: response regulator [Gemmatimonadales bacterium]|nr:response regulator [Gemmatimonadales bacterium]